MRKAIQLISIGIAAYNLYYMVNEFMDTTAGKNFKRKAVKYAEPYVEQAKEKFAEVAEKVMDTVEEETI